MIFKAGLIKQGKEFFDYVIETYEDYNKLINLNDNNDSEYCTLIRILNSCMPSTDWIPVVLSYGRKYGDRGLQKFTQRVACKNIADAVCGNSPSNRIDNLNDIIKLIDGSTDYASVINADEYYSFNENVFMENIQSEIYGRRYTYALLMMLEWKYKEKSEWKEFGTVSIEHILPQRPKSDSQWVIDFDEAQRDYYCHRIGNLCLIGRRKNSTLGNLDYQEKIKRYFEKNIGSFAHTQRIYKDYPTEWTPKTVEENQQRVINDIKEIFGIKKARTVANIRSTEKRTIIDGKSSYMAQQKAIHSNAYKPWTTEDDQRLVQLHSERKSVKELMQIFSRNEGSIESRIKKLI